MLAAVAIMLVVAAAPADVRVVDAAARIDPQAQYDAARSVQDRAERDGCDALVRFARGHVLQAEAVDRKEAWRGRLGRRIATRERAPALTERCERPRSTPRRVVQPPSDVARPARAPDEALSRRLGAVERAFDGASAVWFHDLATGWTAGWNADELFPAASTVKLAVAVAAIRRLGNTYDVRAMLRWSSNLAANRLYGLLGPTAVATELQRLGALHSTYPGAYRVGTAASTRVTTARDLGRILYRLQSEREWQLLDHLLHAEPFRDNVGLFPKRWPTAEKNGWLREARHTAAIVYAPSGPKIVVVLTEGPGLTLPEAQAYARRVLRTLGL